MNEARRVVALKAQTAETQSVETVKVKDTIHQEIVLQILSDVIVLKIIFGHLEIEIEILEILPLAGKGDIPTRKQDTCVMNDTYAMITYTSKTDETGKGGAVTICIEPSNPDDESPANAMKVTGEGHEHHPERGTVARNVFREQA